MRAAAPVAMFAVAAVLVSGPVVHAARGVALSAPGGGARDADPSSTVSNGTTGDPALDYTLHCQGCHRANGTGTAGAVPALAGSMARFLHADAGRAYLARVPGVAQSMLDDAALAALLNWMLARFDPEHVPADFRPYDAQEIGTLRRQPLLEPLSIRNALLGEARCVALECDHDARSAPAHPSR